MIKINIKPMSSNEAWGGRKYKTSEYKVFEQELFYKLPKIEIPKGKLAVCYKFGLSNSNADADNCIKQTQDVISKKYGFNDNKIYLWVIHKIIVKKGEEFIEFDIKKYETDI